MGRVGEGEGGGGKKGERLERRTQLMESYTCTGDVPEILCAKLEPLLLIYLCLWAILSFGETD